MNEFKGHSSPFEHKNQEKPMCLRQDPYDFPYKNTQLGTEPSSHASEDVSLLSTERLDSNFNDGKRTDERRDKSDTDDDDVCNVSDNEIDVTDRGKRTETFYFSLICY